MPMQHPTPNGTTHYGVLVRPAPAGQYTTQAVGLPDVCATAATRDEAVRRVRKHLCELLGSGELTEVEVPLAHPALQWFGHADPNDPAEQVYLEELARFRQEDLEQTLREYDQACSDFSSTPTA